MYGIPEDVDWSYAVGKELLMVSIGRHQVVLRFHGDLTISIEGVFEHLPPNLGSAEGGELPQRAARLVSLIGATVQAMRREDATTLWIGFSNGEGLRLHDSSSNYESFQVTAPGIDIIV